MSTSPDSGLWLAFLDRDPGMVGAVVRASDRERAVEIARTLADRSDADVVVLPLPASGPEGVVQGIVR